MLDKIDIKILNILQTQGKITNADLSRQLDMAPSGVLARVKKLEQDNIIQAYDVRLNPKALGLSLSTFILIKTQDSVGSAEIGRQLAGISEVQEVHWIAGEYNYLVKARVSGTEALTLLMKKFGELSGVCDTRTTLVLDTIKESQAVCLDYAQTKTKK
ncbi:MAG: Lrp/AsnC family transcriptional regulator [Desulfomicrobium sp.]|jgi:Lrp/AsnC family leucine-responsive transcriptional regulator|nr:Lrp/AsnC family transcriptional regulator [Desulfomicrobium sp.]NLV96798.1 Lrp/AsnC family transcriptional regulator [Desulfovibrionales bacterium]